MIGLLWWWMAAGAQELLVKININSQQIEGSDKSVRARTSRYSTT